MPRWLMNSGIAALVPLVLYMLLPTSQVTEIVILSLAVAGCTFLYGQLGLMSFGQGVFFGVGAYSAGLVAVHFSASPDIALLTSIVTASVTAALLGAVAVSRKGVYFALLTVAFSQMFAFLNYSLSWLTGGENGLTDVARREVFLGLPLPIGTTTGFFIFCYVIFVLVMTLAFAIWSSQFGRSLPAIRENEMRAQSLGYDIYKRKLLVFILSGAITGLAGGLHAMFSKFVPPSTIDLEMSEKLMLMTILGGKGSLHGAWLGTGFMMILSDFLGQYWPRYPIIIGLMLIGVVLFVPTGLFGLARIVLGKSGKSRREVPIVGREQVHE